VDDAIGTIARSRRLRIAAVGASPCGACDAACCRQTATEFAVLLQTDVERQRFAPWAITLPIRDDDGNLRHERVIAYRDGRCPFLGEDHRCTIYEDRPLGCREFDCTRYYRTSPGRSHGMFLQRNPRVAMLLESLETGVDQPGVRRGT
jgi:Fe-S-cluster containining protein